MPFAVRAECGTRKAGNSRLVEHTTRDGRGVALPQTGDVREDVKGARRGATAHALDAVEPGDDRVAALSERAHHLGDLGWPLVHRDDAGALRERSGAGHRVRDELGHRLYQGSRERAVPE